MEEISHEEYAGWHDFFSRYPEGWREDLRTYYIMSASGMSKMKQKPEDIFPSIAALKKAEAEKPGEEVATSSLKKSVFGMLLESAMEKPGGKDAN